VFSGTGSGAPTPEPVEFHHIKPEYSTRSLEKALKKGQITEDDRTLIQNHIAWVEVTRNISPGRVNKLTYHLVKLRRFLGPYRTNTIDDIYAGISRLKSVRTKGHPYTANTLRDDIATLKKFYVWMIKKGFSPIPKDDIQEIKVPGGCTMTKTAAQMLTEEEIHRMIKACTRSIDRCYIAVLYEAALRIKELGTLTWDQVSFGNNTVIINTDGKTGKPRHIPVIMAKPYLAQWRSDYPLVPEGTAHVFISEHEKKPLRYKALEKRLRVIATRAGITKKVTPHLLRHTRISHLVGQGVREYSAREIGWGNQSTKMLATYAHIANVEIDAELSQLYGIEPEDSHGKHALYPRQCPHCAAINSPTSNYCASCGVPLTPEAKVTIDELTTEIEAHPIYQHIMGQIEQMMLTPPVNKVGTGARQVWFA
jgi:site-specific recombinase XerD